MKLSKIFKAAAVGAVGGALVAIPVPLVGPVFGFIAGGIGGAAWAIGKGP